MPEKYGLIDPHTGYTLNLDGGVSAQIHQIDRFGHLINKWLGKMMNGEGKWEYNQREPFCTTEGSQKLPTMSHEIPTVEDFIIDFEEVRNFANDPLENIKGFTTKEYEGFMMAPAGREHYALLNFLSQKFGDCRHITDSGTRYVSSALAMASNLRTPVWTFDLPTSKERVHAFRGKTEDDWQNELHQVGANVTFYNVDLMKASDEDFKKYLNTWFVMLDTHHRPYTVPFEREFFTRVLNSGYKGLMLLDDVNEHDEMRRWWKEVQDGAAAGGYKVYLFTPIGHWSGTGFVDFSGKLKVKDGSQTIQPLSPVGRVVEGSEISCDSSPCQGTFAYSPPNKDASNAVEVMTEAIKTYKYGNVPNSPDNNLIFMPTKTDPKSCVEEWKNSRSSWVDRWVKYSSSSIFMFHFEFV